MLDLHLKHVLAQAAGAPDLCDLPPDACRSLYRQICTAATVPPADVEVTPHEARFGGQALRVRVYRPRGAAGALPVTLYFHGGGFVLGDLEAYDAVCRQLCADSGVMVVSAAYRLAPEHPYPAAVEDCFAALGWVAEAIRGFGGDPARLAVAGDSAGAALAATTALMARDAGGLAIAFQPSASYRSGQYFSADNNPLLKQQGYWLLGGRIALKDEDGRWEAAVFGRNLTRKKYINYAVDLSDFGFIEQFRGEPRMFGVEFRVKY